MSLSFSMLTPERLIIREEVEGVSLPAADGRIAVLPHHTHIVVGLIPGEMHYAIKDQEGMIEIRRYRIARGIAEMSRRGVLTVFTREAEVFS